MRDSFIMYTEYEEQFRMLSAEQLQQVVFAIFDYVKTYEEPNIADPVARIVFVSIRNRLKYDYEKWLETCEKRRAAGARGGAVSKRKKANASSAKQKEANVLSAKQGLANEAEYEYDSEHESEYETPPMPPEGASGARRSSPIRTGMPSKAHPAYRGFCAVWQVYPLQQGEDDAWRTYARLYDDGVLPESYALRDAVIEMAENDVRWKDGKMPLMANWLDGHRWKDRPLRAQEEKPAAKKQRPAWMLPVPTGPAPERRPAKMKEVEEDDGCIIDLE